jgi:hypothetical protein
MWWWVCPAMTHVVNPQPGMVVDVPYSQTGFVFPSRVRQPQMLLEPAHLLYSLNCFCKEARRCTGIADCAGAVLVEAKM